MFMLLFQYNKLSASDGVQFGFRVGLSTPSDKLADVYNKQNGISITKDAEDNFASLKDNGMSAGYFVGMRLKVALSDYADFYGSLSWNKFPEKEIDIFIDEKFTAKLKQSTNVIPINAGIQLYLFKSLIGVYGLGEVGYNYINSSVDIPVGIVSVDFSNSPSYNRIGFGLGLGVDVNLKLVTLNVEGKYNYANFIGKADDEDKKSFVQFGVGIYF
jgi:hypothetical protein